MKKRVFLIGIPHFDWKLVKLMLRSKRFKHFKEFFEKSCYGDMIPQQDHCSSPVEFTSMITGVRKEKHLIGYGEGSDKEYIKNGRMITRLDINAKTVWEIAQEYGKKVGVYHWLLTWPPQKVNGFMITDRLSQNENKVYPPELKTMLDEREFEIANMFNPQSAIFLIKKYDVDLFVGMDDGAHGPNHTLWEYIESKNSKRKEVKEGRTKLLSLYEWLDEFLGAAEKEFPDANIIITTDSGMRIADTPVYCTGGETIDLFKKLNIDMQLYAYDLYPPNLPKVAPKLYLPNRSRKEKDRIISALSKIKIEATGERFIKNIKWKGSYLSFSFNFYPSLVENSSGYLGLILPNEERFKLWITKLTGVSFPYGGAFMAKGTKIKENFYVGKVNTVDIAPTILYLLGLKVPETDGKILTEILK